MPAFLPKPLRKPVTIAYEAWTLMSDRHVGLIAAGIAFFAIFAVFPAIAAVVAIWALFSDPLVVADYMSELSDFLPGEAFTILNDQVMGVATAATNTLGWTTFLSLCIALWSARAGVSALVQGINAAFGLPNRGGLGHQLVALVLTLMLVATALTAVAAEIVVPLVLEFAPLGAFEPLLYQLARLPIAPIATVIGIGIVYRYGPNMDWPKPSLFSVGQLVAVLLWLAASKGFTLYLTNFANYNKVYGSIGAVIALLMWLYLSAYSVLMGAAVNAALQEHRRKRAAEAEAPAAAVQPPQ